MPMQLHIGREFIYKAADPFKDLQDFPRQRDIMTLTTLPHKVMFY